MPYIGRTSMRHGIVLRVGHGQKLVLQDLQPRRHPGPLAFPQRAQSAAQQGPRRAEAYNIPEAQIVGGGPGVVTVMVTVVTPRGSKGPLGFKRWARGPVRGWPSMPEAWGLPCFEASESDCCRLHYPARHGEGSKYKNYGNLYIENFSQLFQSPSWFASSLPF